MKTYEVKLTLVVSEKPGVDMRLRVASHRVDSVTELNPMKVEVKP